MAASRTNPASILLGYGASTPSQPSSPVPLPLTDHRASDSVQSVGVLPFQQHQPHCDVQDATSQNALFARSDAAIAAFKAMSENLDAVSGWYAYVQQPEDIAPIPLKLFSIDKSTGSGTTTSGISGMERSVENARSKSPELLPPPRNPIANTSYQAPDGSSSLRLMAAGIVTPLQLSCLFPSASSTPTPGTPTSGTPTPGTPTPGTPTQPQALKYLPTVLQVLNQI